MRKIIFLFVAALGVSGVAQAQAKFSAGPIAGLSVANLDGDIFGDGWKPGMMAGLSFDYVSDSKVGVSSQLFYTQMGRQFEPNGDRIDLHYAQVPVMASYLFGKPSSATRFGVFAGPHANFLLVARTKDGFNLNATNFLGKPVRLFDLGMTAGCRIYMRNVNDIYLYGDFRYGIGFIDVDKLDSGRSINHGMGMNVGLSFPIRSLGVGSGSGTLR